MSEHNKTGKINLDDAAKRIKHEPMSARLRVFLPLHHLLSFVVAVVVFIAVVVVFAVVVIAVPVAVTDVGLGVTTKTTHDEDENDVTTAKTAGSISKKS